MRSGSKQFIKLRKNNLLITGKKMKEGFSFFPPTHGSAYMIVPGLFRILK